MVACDASSFSNELFSIPSIWNFTVRNLSISVICNTRLIFRLRSPGISLVLKGRWMEQEWEIYIIILVVF
jgi:hypothetical protein